MSYLRGIGAVVVEDVSAPDDPGITFSVTRTPVPVAKAGFNPLWLLGGLVAVWYVRGLVREFPPSTHRSFRGQHADDRALT